MNIHFSNQKLKRDGRYVIFSDLFVHVIFSDPTKFVNYIVKVYINEKVGTFQSPSVFVFSFMLPGFRVIAKVIFLATYSFLSDARLKCKVIPDKKGLLYILYDF